MQANVGIFARSAARFAPDAIALRQAHRTLSYQMLDRKTDAIACNLLEWGLVAGDRIALSAPNSIEFVLAYFGIAKAGGVVVPFNVMLKEAEISHILRDSGARGIIYSDDAAASRSDEIKNAASGSSCRTFWPANCEPVNGAEDEEAHIGGFAALAETNRSVSLSLPMTNADDIAAILYTSGTTGTPKGAMLTQGNLCFSGLTNAEAMGFGNEDIILLTLPLFHVFGQVVMMLGGMSRMACLELVPRFDPAIVLETMYTHKITMFGGVPTMYSALLAAGAACPAEKLEAVRTTLRLCVSGASSLPTDLLEKFRNVFCHDILDGYGLTEASPTVAFSRRDRAVKPDSVGKAVWGVEVRIVGSQSEDVATGEAGEIWCRGPNVFAGYWQRPEATEEAFENGWLKTGDIGCLDSDGDLRIIDRIKDIIIRGGYNVYPTEVENVMLAHPAIEQCSVIGVPDDHYGEEVAAHVVKKSGDRTSEDEIIAWAKKQLAGYKYPRQIIFRDSMPLTGSGKVMKRLL